MAELDRSLSKTAYPDEKAVDVPYPRKRSVGAEFGDASIPVEGFTALILEGDSLIK